ncbi:serine carboxypeptidase-like 17 [Nymphaea colorata]|nr:serine carboxypeptidase-like 17 [Nymphaea colorata]
MRTLPEFQPFTFYIVLLLVLSWKDIAAAPASSSRLIRFLPGFDGPLPFELYTGYISVGMREETHLFYYFIKSEKSPAQDPLLLWLTGGPGCSAFSGIALEIGPMKFEEREYNGSLPRLVLNPYSWTKVSNVIFLDAPTGTGFSYSNTKEDYLTGDFKASNDNYMFLVKWLHEFPEFRSNPFYVGGDSYSGLPIPFLVQQIANGNREGYQPFMNLEGYILGNPSTELKFDVSLVPFAYGMGLISEELYKEAEQSCGGRYDIARNAECAKNIYAVNQCVNGINTNNILEPNCLLSFIPNMRRSDGAQIDSHLILRLPQSSVPSVHCREQYYSLLEYWANDESVRDALHIRKDTIREWVRCNWSVRGSYHNDVKSALEYHKDLTSRGYRLLVYSGDHDTVVPFVGTRRWVASLNYTVNDAWRSWWADGQIAGFTISYDHDVTFATLKGGGHTAPEYKPRECLTMVGRWLSHSRL